MPAVRKSKTRTLAVDADLEKLYQSHATALYRYAVMLTGSIEDAEDAVSEVFARIARMGFFQGFVARRRAYLLKAVRNTCFGQIRSRKRSAALYEGLARESAREVASPEAGLSGPLVDAFLLLPEDQREVVGLKVFHQLTFREIARITQCSPNTVQSRYRYGIQKLKQAAEDTPNG